jgi:hypothetical protein
MKARDDKVDGELANVANRNGRLNNHSQSSINEKPTIKVLQIQTGGSVEKSCMRGFFNLCTLTLYLQLEVSVWYEKLTCASMSSRKTQQKHASSSFNMHSTITDEQLITNINTTAGNK